ncbi:MAG: hypothetical protein KGR18_06010 [Acidobacteria bacterium]|nr:hypothetical protein [Acidobacteriota bacterium]
MSSDAPDAPRSEARPPRRSRSRGSAAPASRVLTAGLSVAATCSIFTALALNEAPPAPKASAVPDPAATVQSLVAADGTTVTTPTPTAPSAPVGATPSAVPVTAASGGSGWSPPATAVPAQASQPSQPSSPAVPTTPAAPATTIAPAPVPTPPTTPPTTVARTRPS